MHKEELIEILKQFDGTGKVVSVENLGSGHIHDTYRVEMEGPDSSGYVLQRINHHVFRQIDVLMDNMLRVTAHLEARSEEERKLGLSSFPSNLTLVSTLGGAPYYRDANGDYWRVTVCMPEARSYDAVATAGQAYAGGWAFGKFHRLLEDLDPGTVEEVIPRFHHIGHRLHRLEEAIALDSLGRAGGAAADIQFIRSRQDRMMRILRMGEAGEIPLRIIHNDTKFNNVLLNSRDEAICVIDLDTVMPGYLAYDFGDAIRTVINSGDEDDADLEKIELNVPLFEAYAAGYFETAGDMITQKEADSLIEGVLLLPYMQAVRFLTDYLEGDHYFKISHPLHNLQRTRAQLRLVRELETKEGLLRKIIGQQCR